MWASAKATRHWSHCSHNQIRFVCPVSTNAVPWKTQWLMSCTGVWKSILKLSSKVLKDAYSYILDHLRLFHMVTLCLQHSESLKSVPKCKYTNLLLQSCPCEDLLIQGFAKWSCGIFQPPNNLSLLRYSRSNDLLWMRPQFDLVRTYGFIITCMCLLLYCKQTLSLNIS